MIDKENLALPEEKAKILTYLNEYLITGGFPEVVVKNLDPKIYLETLFDAILFLRFGEALQSKIFTAYIFAGNVFNV